MSRLQDIPIQVLDGQGGQSETGNVAPVLHEIRHALARLASTGESTSIDLSAIPFAPGDEAALFGLLGQGEVSAVVNALGETRIEETTYPGVWLVTHRSPQETVLSTQIEITRTPSLLSTPAEDLSDALDALDHYLSSPTAQESA